MIDFTEEPKTKEKKSRKVGKQFEEDFRKSIPADVFYYRFRDGTAAWGNLSENIRFQSENLCDNMLFYRGKLFLLELKSVQGKSFSFRNVRKNQLKELEKASKFPGITAGFIINFRDIEKTVFIEVNEFIDIMNRSGKKSFNQKDLEYHHYTDIDCKKLKVHYRYDVEKFVKGE